MYGGFFTGGDKSNDARIGTPTPSGYVAVSVNYRLRPGASNWRDMYLASLDAYDDAIAAVDWLRLHAAEYGIDPDAIVASGFSGGGRDRPRTSPSCRASGGRPRRRSPPPSLSQDCCTRAEGRRSAHPGLPRHRRQHDPVREHGPGLRPGGGSASAVTS